MKRRLFLKLLALTAAAPKVAAELLSKSEKKDQEELVTTLVREDNVYKINVSDGVILKGDIVTICADGKVRTLNEINIHNSTILGVANYKDHELYVHTMGA